MEFDAVDVSQSDKSAVRRDTVSNRHVDGYREQSTGLDLVNTGAGPYSVTAKFHIVTDGTQGQSNATIDMVPGPIVGAGLPGLIMACVDCLLSRGVGASRSLPDRWVLTIRP